jgi:hypothetical protein
LPLTEIQGFSYIYKSTKTGFGFIWDFSDLRFFFAGSEAGAKRQACETRQIKTLIGGEEAPVGVVTESLTPGVNRHIQQYFFASVSPH